MIDTFERISISETNFKCLNNDFIDYWHHRSLRDNPHGMLHLNPVRGGGKDGFNSVRRGANIWAILLNLTPKNLAIGGQ